MKFTLPIVPKPQMRARHGRTKTGFSVTYKAEAQRQAENNLCALLLPHRPDRPMEGPLILTVTAYLPVPMSWSGKKIGDAETGKIKPICKPDVSNLAKNIEDCMTTMGFFRDDSHIQRLISEKLYNDGRGPRWEIEIVPAK